MELLQSSYSPFAKMVLKKCQERNWSEQLTIRMIEGVKRVETNLPSLTNEEEKYSVVSLFAEKQIEKNAGSQFERMLNETNIAMEKQKAIYEKALEDKGDIIQQQFELFDQTKSIIQSQDTRIEELQELLSIKRTSNQN